MPRHHVSSLAFASLLAAAPALAADAAGSDLAATFDAAVQVIESRYVRDVRSEELRDAALRELAKSLDPYSAYMSPEECRELDMQLEGHFSGIGVRLGRDEARNLLRVEFTLGGSPALEAGLAPGDLILRVDGKSTFGLSVAKGIPLLKGPAGSRAELAIERPGESEPKAFRIERRRIQTSTVRAVEWDSDGSWDFLHDEARRLGYIRITSFGESTAEDVRLALKDLEARQARGLVLDLRDSLGGLFRAAVEVADLFLESGTIVVTTGRGESESREVAHAGAVTIPMVLLINEGTISSGEVLAAALQDNGRVLVLGSRSYGKGFVQQIIPLPVGEGALRLTIAAYMRPSGAHIDRHATNPPPTEWGVSPDAGMEMLLSKEQYEAWSEATWNRDIGVPFGAAGKPVAVVPIEDSILDRAFEELARTIASR